MTINKNTHCLIFIALIFTGCASYSIQTENLVSQLREKQQIAPNGYFQQFSAIDYPSNNLDKIKCQNKNGDYVWLYPNKNTEFIFIRKSTGKKVKAYFDTVIFQNDSLFGLRSRLLGGVRAIPVGDIEKITIYAETPKVEPATK